MDDVLIVSKTSNGQEIFLGGVNLTTKRNVQLGPGHVGYAHQNDIQMNIGEVWQLELGRFPEMEIRAPHTENWNTMWKGAHTKTVPRTELRHFILNHLNAPYVQPSALFDGLIEFNENGKAFIEVGGSLPNYSVGLWRFHDPLHLDNDNNENEDGNYFHSESRDFRVKYTGVSNPERVLPPGTILRFFLSQPYEFMGKDVYWLLLSGWF